MACFSESDELQNGPDFELMQNGPVTLFFKRALLDEKLAWLREHQYKVVEVDCSQWKAARSSRGHRRSFGISGLLRPQPERPERLPERYWGSRRIRAGTGVSKIRQPCHDLSQFRLGDTRHRCLSIAKPPAVRPAIYDSCLVRRSQPIVPRRRRMPGYVELSRIPK